MAAVWRDRNCALFLGGEGISTLGDGIQQVTLLWLVVKWTGSGLVTGTVMMASVVPMLAFSFLGGLLVDRVSRRQVLIVCEILRALMVAGMATAVAVGLVQDKIYLLYLYAVLLGSVRAFFLPGRDAALPALAPTGHLAGLNATVALNRQLSMVLGPAIGAMLVGSVGFALPLYLDALTFVASAIAFVLIRNLDSGRRPTIREGWGQQAGQALRFFREAPAVTGLVLAMSLCNLFLSSFSVLLPLYAERVLGSGVQVYGLLMAASAGGLMLGSLANGLAPARLEGLVARGAGVLLAISAIGLSIGLLALFPMLAVAVALVMARGFATTTANIRSLAIFQTHVPGELRGRVFSLMQVMGVGLQPVGLGLGGLVSDLAGVTPTLLGTGVALVLVGFAGHAWGGVRGLRVPGAWSPAASGQPATGRGGDGGRCR